MSQDKRHHHDFVNKTVDHVDKHPKELLPVLKEFKEMVENDSRLFMLFESMFDQVCPFPPAIFHTATAHLSLSLTGSPWQEVPH